MQYDLTEWKRESLTGKKYLFLAADHFSKVVWGRAIPNKTAGVLRDTIADMIKDMGKPETVISDNGSEFRNKEVDGLLSTLDIAVRHPLPYQKTANGGVERVNLTITRKVCVCELCPAKVTVF